jgi:heat-inducible transcriptional repressor
MLETYYFEDIPDLTQREQIVLQHLIRQYILTANPIGSRTISKQAELNLGAASIRNIMSDLEEKGFLNHPHTSAGRVPTDRGYRYYVDRLSSQEPLSGVDKEYIEAQLDGAPAIQYERVIRESSRILSQISHQLAVVSSPHIGQGRLQHIDMVEVASHRIMVILSITSGIVKTIVFEIESDVTRDLLHSAATLLNERLAGLTLREIRETVDERLRDTATETQELLGAVKRSSQELFSDRIDDVKVHIDGMRVIMLQPEFGDPERLRDIIEMVENQSIIIHILDSIGEDTPLTVRIGHENPDEKLHEYSLIAAPYHVGALTGTLSIIGPRRMNYPRIMALVDFLAKALSHS